MYVSLLAAFIKAVGDVLFGWLRSKENDATNRQAGRLDNENDHLRAELEAGKKAEAAREAVQYDDFHKDVDRL